MNAERAAARAALFVCALFHRQAKGNATCSLPVNPILVQKLSAIAAAIPAAD
jgi:hypothetical protein